MEWEEAESALTEAAAAIADECFWGTFDPETEAERIANVVRSAFWVRYNEKLSETPEPDTTNV